MRSPFSSISKEPSITTLTGVACPLPATVWHVVLDSAFLVDFLPETLNCLGIHGLASDNDCGISLFLLDAKLAFD